MSQKSEQRQRGDHDADVSHPPERGGDAHESTQHEFPEDLERLVRSVELLACDNAMAEARLAYAMATLAQRVTGRRLVGSSGTAVCAARLGCSRQKLQSYAPIAMRWDKDHFSRLIERSCAGRARLSASHLLVIASLPRSVGERWLAELCDHGMTVRELKARVAQTGAPQGDRRRE